MKYPVELRWSKEDDAWIAEVYDLPGCMADGKTQALALKAAEKAVSLWIEVAKADGRHIPVPLTDDQASGQLLLRLPRSLHASLRRMARRDGVSLNEHLIALLAGREAALEARAK